MKLRSLTAWLAYEQVSMTSVHITESPYRLANHEAKARGQQLEEAMRLTEEKYKELQAGQYVEC